LNLPINEQRGIDDYAPFPRTSSVPAPPLILWRLFIFPGYIPGSGAGTITIGTLYGMLVGTIVGVFLVISIVSCPANAHRWMKRRLPRRGNLRHILETVCQYFTKFRKPFLFFRGPAVSALAPIEQ
jgi:hypothetical protein